VLGRHGGVSASRGKVKKGSKRRVAKWEAQREIKGEEMWEMTAIAGMNKKMTWGESPGVRSWGS